MYPSDMADAQWQVLAKHFAEMNKRGRLRVRSARDMPARLPAGKCFCTISHCSSVMSLEYMTRVCRKFSL